MDIDITRSLHFSAAPTNEAKLLPTLPVLPSNPPSCLSHAYICAAFVGRRIIFTPLLVNSGLISRPIPHGGPGCCTQTR